MFKISNKNKLSTNLKSVLKTDLISTDIWQALGKGEFRPAAVLVPLFWQGDELHIMLTKRSEQLKHHSGQISFPGGGFDKADMTIRQSAIRETHEEIGIEQKYIEVVGYLDNIKTISGFFVTPFVAILKSGYQIKINPDEVSEVFSVPLKFFLNANNCQQHSATFKGKNIKYYVYRHETYNIWGVTAEIIVKLIKKIS